MRNIKKLRNKEDGAFSILFVILTLIAVLFVVGYIDMMKQSYVLNEVQGVMDISGVSALQAGVDKEKLRQEEFVYSEDRILSAFYELVYKGINTGDTISYRKLTNVEVTEKPPSVWGLGQTSKARHQLFLDSTMILRIKTSSQFDTITNKEKEYFDSKNNQMMTVTFNGTTGDGETELIVRSVSRLVYR